MGAYETIVRIQIPVRLVLIPVIILSGQVVCLAPHRSLEAAWAVSAVAQAGPRRGSSRSARGLFQWESAKRPMP
jgi:hypothetical protein